MYVCMYTHVFSTLKPSAVSHFLGVDSQVAFPIVDCARSRLHGSLASGYGAPSGGRWLFFVSICSSSVSVTHRIHVCYI